MEGELVFALNGDVHRVAAEQVDAADSLLDYVRNVAGVTGPKEACGEGGCGACAVTMRDASGDVISINACLKPLATMHGLDVTTTEGLCKTDGIGKQSHPVQQRLAEFNGTQCGFCTPGMVMGAYTARKRASDRGEELTPLEMERALDGNLCRCTGYRPILDAAKSFCEEGDIEDFVGCGRALPHGCGDYDHDLWDPPRHTALPEPRDGPAAFESRALPGLRWERARTLADACRAAAGGATVVCGSTGAGIYKDQFPRPGRRYVDVAGVPGLDTLELAATDELRIGAAVPLQRLLELIEGEVARAVEIGKQGSAVLRELGHCVRRIAGTHVRHAGTVGGNICLARNHAFLSDLCTALAALDATVEVARLVKGEPEVQSETLVEFLLQGPVQNTVLTSITVPAQNYSAAAFYKQAHRRQNAHSFVNAFLAACLSAPDADGKVTITSLAAAFNYGRAGERVRRARHLQDACKDLPLSAEGVAKAVAAVQQDIDEWFAACKHVTTSVPELPKDNVPYRRALVRSFAQKFLQGLVKAGGGAGALALGVGDLPHAPKRARQDVGVADKRHEPVSLPIMKKSATIQTTGEAQFTADVPLQPGTLHGAVVTATVPRGRVVSVSTDRARQLLGDQFVAFYSSEDVPGRNEMSVFGISHIFTSPLAGGDKEVLYQGHPVGLVVARSEAAAAAGAAAVDVSYERLPHTLTLEEALRRPDNVLDLSALSFLPFPVHCKSDAPVADAVAAAPQRVSGTTRQDSQQHFYLEPHVAYATPEEGGAVVVRIPTQYVDATHATVAGFLGLPLHRVRVVSRRLGGGFGGKCGPVGLMLGAVTALACMRLRRPVRVRLSRATDMALSGGREEVLSRFEAGFDSNGRIHGLRIHSDVDAGAAPSLSIVTCSALAELVPGVYDFAAYDFTTALYRTNKPDRQPVRGPGHPSCLHVMENIVEQIAEALGKDPLEVRMANLVPEGREGKLMVGTPASDYGARALLTHVVEKARYLERRAAAEAFNNTHTWRKRGVAALATVFKVEPSAKNVLVNVYGDGSVVIHSATAEMGQGSWTKLAQAVAYQLRNTLYGSEPDAPTIPVDDIAVRGIDSDVLPNVMCTGGSVGSETSAEAARVAAEVLAERMRPALEALKASTGSVPNWAMLCNMAKMMGVHLSESHTFPGHPGYAIYGAIVCEAEIDVLTGQHSIPFAHLILDCGKSMNPSIDIGQIEGAFMLGCGQALLEKMATDEDGRCLTDGSWEYKPPSSVDVPDEFIVETRKNSTFDAGTLSSKATGEPPLLLASAVPCAIRMAIQAARKDNGLDRLGSLPSPLLMDAIHHLCHEQS
mmetsp:Transcript_5005/g.14025  ORF Transcript_5005/g.14025 Transcript_5005/m.14025 type:complete len:1324 (+) Transcript_5005:114-4085(+)